jgi:hypothetical protein
MLAMYAGHYFEEITTGDESWFQYSSYSDSMFVDSRESIVARIPQDISGQKAMTGVFLTSTRLLVVDTLSKGTKFNQDYFIDAIFPGLSNGKTRNSRKKPFPVLFVHMDNSISHKGHKMSENVPQRSIE